MMSMMSMMSVMGVMGIMRVTRGGSMVIKRAAASGFAMVPILVFTLVSFLALTASYERLYQLFAYEESSDRVPASSDGIQEALGKGLARLHTGEPTVDVSNRYECDLKLRDSDGDLVTYQLTYKKLNDNEWWLRAEPAGDPLPDCPPSFTDNACPPPPLP